jgi:hypothetical protein
MDYIRAARQKRDAEHARWRVGFQQSLLDAHRMMPTRGEGWNTKLDYYVKQLQEAEDELARLTAASSHSPAPASTPR